VPYPRTYRSAWSDAEPSAFESDPATVLLALVFEAQVDGYILGAKFARDLSDEGQHVAFLATGVGEAWSRAAPFTWRPATGSGFDRWESTYFRPRLRLLEGERCLIAVFFQTGKWSANDGGLVGAPLGNEFIQVPQDTSEDHTTFYTYLNDLNPNNTFGGNAYGVDCIFWPH
jgi:hypothetical protein